MQQVAWLVGSSCRRRGRDGGSAESWLHAAEQTNLFSQVVAWATSLFPSVLPASTDSKQNVPRLQSRARKAFISNFLASLGWFILPFGQDFSWYHKGQGPKVCAWDSAVRPQKYLAVLGHMWTADESQALLLTAFLTLQAGVLETWLFFFTFNSTRHWPSVAGLDLILKWARL